LEKLCLVELSERLRILAQRRTGGDVASDNALRAQAFRLAMPAVGEQFLSLMVGTVNTMLVGHLGASALAAVGLSGTIAALAAIFFSAVSTGATALIAQAVGADNRPLANRVLAQATIMALVLGLLGGLVLFPVRRQALMLMGAQSDSLPMGLVYLTCITASLPFSSLLTVGNASLRGSGDTRTPMLIMGGVNIVNVLLSYSLIRGVGSLPQMGVAGAGVAAVTATSLGSLTVMAVLLRGRGSLRLQLPRQPDWETLKRLLNISLPAGGESLLMSFAFTAYARSISSLGTIPYAAYLIAQRIEALSSMPAMGFAMAATTLSGQALGAGDPARARRSVFRTIEIALCLALPVSLISLTFPQYMLGIFTRDPVVIAQGILPVRLVGIAQPFMSVAFALAGGLRGAGATRLVMAVTGFSAWLVRVPLAILSVTLLKLGLPGVQASMMLDWLMRTALYCTQYRAAVWQKRVAALHAKITPR
jgi:multidrug resistance protein, MATE family